MEYECGINLTVRDLKECLKDLPDDMDVIVTVAPENEPNSVLGFKYVRTIGTLVNPYEAKPALCLAPTTDGLDMYGLMDRMHGATTVEKLLF